MAQRGQPRSCQARSTAGMVSSSNSGNTGST